MSRYRVSSSVRASKEAPSWNNATTQDRSSSSYLSRQPSSPPTPDKPLVASLYAGYSKAAEERSANRVAKRVNVISPQHGNNISPEMSPTEGALQFIPALSSDTFAASSWDAISPPEEKKEVSPPGPRSSASMAAKARQFKKTRQITRAVSPAASVSRSASPRMSPRSDDRSSTPSNGRIARIAAMFSSRATVRSSDLASSPTTQNSQVPPSPAYSSSSSGYVGWPGTQDKMGKTVTLQSSYDDSSAGPSYDLELRRTAQRNMDRWEDKSDLASSHRSPEKGSTHDYLVKAIAESNPRTPLKLRSPSTSTPAYRSAPSETRPGAVSRSGKMATISREWGSAPSSPASRTSSAYLNVKDMNALAYPDLNTKRTVPPTEETLAVNDHLAPPHRSFPAKGYRGLIEKTKEVPSLMDVVDSDSISSRATSTYSRGNAKNFSETDSDVFDGLSVTKESDVFDNISDARSPRKSVRGNVSYPERIAEEGEDSTDVNDFKVVMLGKGLTVIQSSEMSFVNRQTASDYDENLTNSEVDQNGFHRVPGFNEMLTAGQKKDFSLLGIQGNFGSRTRASTSVLREDLTESESGSSLFTDPYNESFELDGDLSEFYIPARVMKKVVQKYRKLSDRADTDMSLEDFEREEDERKAFALFEMRSRIMEKDIERGLERRGGTVFVDDLVTTPYNRTAHRIRDAVIVSKAWRDGASPQDVINTALLTRRRLHAYYVKRSSDPKRPFVEDPTSLRGDPNIYYWERVRWVDDTDFLLYRCPSIGPRHLRGFEIFTIGDCQSILLKLTNERCVELRGELNEATKRQIEAEEQMKEDVDGDDGILTEAEMDYLASMEEVKTISKKLVAAEQAFTLVRDRIEKLVARYEAMLTKIETESYAGASSIFTCESSYYSDSEYWNELEEREREMWARRAQRAEIRAELAAREAILARQETQKVRLEKERELEALQQKLLELQSETSTAIMEKEQGAMLAKSFAMRRSTSASPEPEVSEDVTKQKIDDVKQRFRARMAARKKSNVVGSNSVYTRAPHSTTAMRARPQKPTTPAAPAWMRTAGEEMYQHLDFYERSLKAVESSR